MTVTSRKNHGSIKANYEDDSDSEIELNPPGPG